MKESISRYVFGFVNIIVLLTFTLICVFPFYYLFINTISSNALVTSGKILFLPKEIHFSNYLQILSIRGIYSATIVSIARTVIGTLLTIIGTSFLAYVLTRPELFARKIVYRFLIITMYFNAGLIPWFMNMKMLHLTNNFWAYILPVIISPFSVVLVKTFMESIPNSLHESAEIDGAGYLILFSRIIFPLAIPIVATIAIFSAVGQWNSFTDTLMLVSENKYFTLQFLLYNFLSEAQALAARMRESAGDLAANPGQSLTPAAVKMTVSVVVVFPILLVYPVFQRFFIKGIMIGAIKQ